MAAYNDVTNDLLINKKTSEAYRSNWDNIFGKKEELLEPAPFLSEEIPLNILEEET